MLMHGAELLMGTLSEQTLTEQLYQEFLRDQLGDYIENVPVSTKSRMGHHLITFGS